MCIFEPNALLAFGSRRIALKRVSEQKESFHSLRTSVHGRAELYDLQVVINCRSATLYNGGKRKPAAHQRTRASGDSCTRAGGKDGRIGLDDFRMMVHRSPKRIALKGKNTEILPITVNTCI